MTMVIENCLIQARSGEELFCARSDSGYEVTDVTLKGYAIVPIEKYEALVARATPAEERLA